MSNELYTQALQVLSENKHKTSFEIYDDIYMKEESRLDDLFQKYKEGKLIGMMRENPNLFVTDRKKMLDEIESKIEDRFKGVSQFEKGVYFEHFTLNNPAIAYSKRLLSKAKINGDFKMRLPKSLPQNERVTALAHESLAYYMHQKGRFFDMIKNKQTIEKVKRNKNQ